MSDTPEVRIFDSVTAAVENSAQPAPPPYAVLPVVQDSSSTGGAVTPSDPEVVPVVAKPSGRRTGAKTGGVVAQAGTATTQVKAQGPE